MKCTRQHLRGKETSILWRSPALTEAESYKSEWNRVYTPLLPVKGLQRRFCRHATLNIAQKGGKLYTSSRTAYVSLIFHADRHAIRNIAQKGGKTYVSPIIHVDRPLTTSLFAA